MRKFLVLLSLVFVAVPAFSQGAITGAIGPSYPIRVDTNGNGTADGSDTAIRPTWSTFGPDILSIPTPWDSDPSGNNLYFLGNRDSNGHYTQIVRNNGAEQQMVTFTGYAANGTPNAFRLDADNFFYGTMRSGTGQLLDTNNDGIFDGIQGSGSGVSFSLPFVQVDTNGDGLGDHISIPWSQASLVGVDFADGTPVPGNGGPDPQVWIPLADTNGDGKPDGFVIDLDGNGVPDSGTYAAPGFGPIPAAPAVGGGNGSAAAPTLSEWGALLTVLLLAAAGWMHLNRMNGSRVRY